MLEGEAMQARAPCEEAVRVARQVGAARGGMRGAEYARRCAGDTRRARGRNRGSPSLACSSPRSSERSRSCGERISISDGVSTTPVGWTKPPAVAREGWERLRPRIGSAASLLAAEAGRRLSSPRPLGRSRRRPRRGRRDGATALDSGAGAMRAGRAAGAARRAQECQREPRIGSRNAPETKPVLGRKAGHRGRRAGLRAGRSRTATPDRGRGSANARQRAGIRRSAIYARAQGRGGARRPSARRERRRGRAQSGDARAGSAQTGCKH